MNLSLKKETSNRATLLNIKEASLWASEYLNKKVKGGKDLGFVEGESLLCYVVIFRSLLAEDSKGYSKTAESRWQRGYYQNHSFG